MHNNIAEMTRLPKRPRLPLTICMTAGAILAAASLCACSGHPTDANADTGPVTVFAAASTTDAVKQVAGLYEKQTGAKVRLNFAASSMLARQIESGAPADVFLSADEKWMDYLADRGLIDPASRRDLLGNRLLVVVPADSSLHVRMDKAFDFPASFEGRLAVGDPSHVPAGRYAKETLEAMGWWPALADRLAPGADVRAALRFVEIGEARAGVVYSTDATISDKVKVAGVFPADSHKPIRYPVAMIKSASPGAKAFEAFLRGPKAREVFARYGFEALATHAKPTAPAGGMLDSEAAQAIWLSLKVALWCMLAVAVPGVALGWLLARKQFPGRAVVNAIVHAPLVMPPVVVGYLALISLGRSGVIGRFLEETLGVHLAFTWKGAVVVSAIMGLPLMVRSVRLAMELVDRRLESAAAVLGAGPLRVFATVTLPLALPGVLAGLVLAFARSLGEFGATITFAGNIVGQTQTLPLAIFSRTQSPGGDAAALALAGVSLLLALGALAVSELLTRRAARRVAGA